MIRNFAIRNSVHQEFSALGTLLLRNFVIRNFVIRNFVRQEFCDQEPRTCTNVFPFPPLLFLSPFLEYPSPSLEYPSPTLLFPSSPLLFPSPPLLFPSPHLAICPSLPVAVYPSPPFPVCPFSPQNIMFLSSSHYLPFGSFQQQLSVYQVPKIFARTVGIHGTSITCTSILCKLS